MHVPSGCLVSLALSAACLWPTPASAQSQDGPALGSFISAEQARYAFVTTGYPCDPIVNWGGEASRLQSFVVHDPVKQRVVFVLVFPSADASAAFRGGMALSEHSLTSNPHVLAGYGPSIWTGNVGMVESTESQLALVAQFQAEADNGGVDDVTTPDPRTPDFPVDLDFQQALRNGAYL